MNILRTVAAFAVVTAMTACEEMTAPSLATTSSTERAVRTAMGLPDAIEFVAVGTRGSTTTYVLRNPAAASQSQQSRRLATAAVDDDARSVARQYDTPRRSVTVRGDTVEFMENTTYPELTEAIEAATRKANDAHFLVEAVGEVLEVGGVNVDAIREWIDRQAELVELMQDWLEDAFSDYLEGPRLPNIEVRDALFHDPVLFVLELTPGETFAYTAPAVTGGYGTVTYFAGEGYSTETDDSGLGPTGGTLTSADPLPAWMTFNASTRVLSGTVPLSILPGEWNRHIYGAYDELGRDDFEPWLWKVVDAEVEAPKSEVSTR